MRTLLERVEVQLRRSATILRARNRLDEAARAERYAARIRLTLDEPLATRRMRSLTPALYDAPDRASILERALDGAITLTGGDLGNVQLRSLGDGTLRIAAHRGFDSDFLERFAIVDDARSACGRAASGRSQTVIADVNTDPAFACHRAIAAASGFRAVQSTPLIDRDGHLHGVISTHFRQVHQPCERDLAIMRWYGEHVAAALARSGTRPTRVASAALHEGSAQRQEASASLMEDTARMLGANGHADLAATRREEARRARVQAHQGRARAGAVDGTLTPADAP